jgi:hypothetical protein
MTRKWEGDPDAFRALLSEVANLLQICVGLSALVRQHAQQHADNP